MRYFKDRNADIKMIYKTVDGINLPIHVFLPDNNVHNAKTIVAIHGGGWTDAIKNNEEWSGGWMANNAKYFAERGFTSIVISYRSLTVSPNLSVEDILTDCKDALVYIRKNLHLVNFSNIIYIGDSAGGYIATMLGLSENDYIRPSKVIALNPVLGSLDDKWEYAFHNVSDISKLIPSKIIGNKCAAFLFVHGTADTVAEIDYTKQLHKLLQKKGQKSKLITLPNIKHAFGLYDYLYPDEFVSDVMETVLKNI